MCLDLPTRQFWTKSFFTLFLALLFLNPSYLLANCGFSIQGAVKVDASCGNSDGAIDLELVGGTLPFTFAWSHGATTQSVSGLPAGVYTATVSDASTCSATISVVIQDLGGATINTISATPATCQNNDGSISVDFSGTGPFNINWTGPVSGSFAGVAVSPISLTALTAGDYTIEVEDANGCSTFEVIEVPETGAISMTTVVTQDATCAGGTDGIIQAQATSGSLPFEFFIDGVSQGAFPSNSFDFTGLASGHYEISIVDGSGCSILDTVTVNEAGSAPLNAGDFAFTDATCPSAADGTATAVVSCGACEVFNLETGLSMGTLAAPVTNLTAGYYEVRFSNAGCISRLPFTIGGPDAWEVVVAMDNPSCTAGDADIDISVSGGTPSVGVPFYTFAWSSGPTTEDIVNVLPGFYTLTVTDALGCTFVADSLEVQPCNSEEIVYVNVDSTITFCVDTNDVGGNVATVINVCAGAVNDGTLVSVASDGCVTYTAGSLVATDTVCVEVCGNGPGACDTTTIVFTTISPIDTTTATVFTGTTNVICADTSALAGNVVSATNLNCSTLDNGALDLLASNGCITYTAGTQMGQDTICVEFCDDLGFCDTVTYVINVASPIDTQNITMQVGATEIFCIDLLPFPDVLQTATNLNCSVLTAGSVTNVDAGTGCLTYEAGNIAGVDTVCLAVCDNAGFCDTTVLVFSSVPVPDTAVITLAAGSAAVDTCPINLQYPGTLNTVSDLNCDNDNVGTILLDALGCVNYTPPASLPGSGTRSDTVCLVLCDDTNPDAYCDTMVYIFNNIEPTCTPVIPTSFITQVEDCDVPEVCIPIPLDSIGDYSIEIDGQPYSGAFGACDLVTRIQYPLSLIPTCASDSFEMTWIIDGVTLGPVTVEGYAGIVDQMNLFDGNSFWTLAGTIAQGTNSGNDGVTYGNLTVSCVGSVSNPIALGAIVQDQFSRGTAITFADTGSFTLQITNVFNCVDVAAVEIFCPQSSVINDTIVLGTSFENCGLDFSEIANLDILFNDCAGAGTGVVSFSIDQLTGCVTYTGDTLGSDLACIVACDSNNICDTTYLFIEVVLDVPVAVNDSATLIFGEPNTFFDICANDTFSTIDYSIAVLDVPLAGSLNGSDCSWEYVLTDNSFCGTDSFTYVLSNPSGADTATVYIEVECKPFSISEGISPNGDGLNDNFVINSLSNYPDHELFIFNRWGNLVYQATNYQNDWAGTFNGKPLPDGTYFYMIKLNNDIGEIETGYLIILR